MRPPWIVPLTFCFAPAAMQAQAQAPQTPSAAASAAEAPRFAILEYQIDGNSVLPVAAIEKAVLPFMGEGRQLSDVEAARMALEKAYQQAGYLTVFVDLPEQRVDSGTVALRVTEGRIERLRVTGSRYHDPGVIRDKVAALAEGGVPDFNQVQRQLAELSRDDRRLQPVLKPGFAPGTVQAELKVDDKLPLAATLELNNRHAAATAPLRLQASLRYDNLFQIDHGIALTAITAPQATSQASVLAASYSVPTGGGKTLLASLTTSDSTVEPLGATTVLGKGTTFGLRWLQAFGSTDSSHQVALGADYKNLKESVVSGSNAPDTLETPLRYLPFQASHTGTWFSERGQASLTSSFTFGVRRLLRRQVECPGNIGPVDQFACKRQGADGGFSVLRSDLRYTGTLASLPGQVALRLGGQVATQPLVSAEQYAVGGAESVRGYLEAEGSGDHAVLGSIEWRGPNLFVDAKADAAASFWNELVLLGFVDVARAITAQPLAGQAARVSLLGSGIGLRLRMRQNVNADLDLAWPLKATQSSPDKTPRIHVRVSAQF